MNIEQAILEFLGKVVAYGGGAAVVAYGMFVFLGKKWIENKFSERLDRLRHDHARELEHLRLEINTLLSRVTKLHEKEFVVVPEAWGKLTDGLFRLKRFVSVFKSLPNLEILSTERLDEFLAHSRLLESERKIIRDAKGKNEQYQELIFWHDLGEVRKSYGEFHDYLEKNCIFMSPDIRKAFSDIDDKMFEVLLKRQIGEEPGDFAMWVEASRQMREQIEPDLTALEDSLQQRLQGLPKR